MPSPGSPTSSTTRPRPATSSPERSHELGHLGVATHDGRRPRDGLSGFWADEREHGYRRLATFHIEVAQRLEDEAVIEPPCRRLSDDDRARFGEGLDSGRDVRRIPEGNGPRLRRPDEPDRRLAAVDRHSDREHRRGPTPLRRRARTRRRPRECGGRCGPPARDRRRERPARRSTRRSRLPRTPAPSRRTPRPRGSSSSRTRRRAP